jgi:hypothetical protein
MSATTAVPTPEQVQRAAWDLILLDIEVRTVQLRQLKTYEPWRLAAALASAGAIAGSAVAAAILWSAHLLAAGVVH